LVEISDQDDVKIQFKNADELRAKLIEQGIPAALLDAPRGLGIDVSAVRAEAERDNQELRKKLNR
jgi:hypothetical protein